MSETPKMFYVVSDLCNGCENCRFICASVISEGPESFNKQKSLIFVDRVAQESYRNAFVACNASPCNGDPKCTRYCPTGAIIFDTPDHIATQIKELLQARKSNAEFKVRAPWALRRNDNVRMERQNP